MYFIEKKYFDGFGSSNLLKFQELNDMVIVVSFWDGIRLAMNIYFRLVYFSIVISNIYQKYIY